MHRAAFTAAVFLRLFLIVVPHSPAAQQKPSQTGQKAQRQRSNPALGPLSHPRSRLVGHPGASARFPQSVTYPRRTHQPSLRSATHSAYQSPARLPPQGPRSLTFTCFGAAHWHIAIWTRANESEEKLSLFPLQRCWILEPFFPFSGLLFDFFRRISKKSCLYTTRSKDPRDLSTNDHVN